MGGMVGTFIGYIYLVEGSSQGRVEQNNRHLDIGE